MRQQSAYQQHASTVEGLALPRVWEAHPGSECALTLVPFTGRTTLVLKPRRRSFGRMPLSDIPGYSEVFPATEGVCIRARDFDQITYIQFDRHYDEDREVFEGTLDLVLTGRGGLLGLRLGNVQLLEIRSFYQWPGFEIDDVRSAGWDRKNFKISCLESDAVLGYSETAQVYKPLPYH